MNGLVRALRRCERGSDFRCADGKREAAGKVMTGCPTGRHTCVRCGVRADARPSLVSTSMGRKPPTLDRTEHRRAASLACPLALLSFVKHGEEATPFTLGFGGRSM